jgi:hypothetical protein
MRTGRPIPPLSVTVEQRSTLENWVRRPKTAQALALRAKIILACAEGKPSGVVAHQVRVRSKRWGNGALVSQVRDWRDCWTSLGRGRRAG